MSFFGIPHYFQDMTTFDAEQLNADFTALLNASNSLQTQINNLDTSTNAGLPNTYVATATAFGMSPTASPSVNMNALQLAVNAVLAAGSGTVYIPAGTYNIAGTVTITGSSANPGIIIRGASTGTVLLQQNPNSDTFQISQFGTNNSAGCHFQNLTFQYVDQSVGTGSAIHITGSAQGVDAFQCIFQHCPIAFNSDINTGLQCGLTNCIIIQNKYSNANIGQIMLGGTQMYVDSCLLRQNNGSPNGGPANNIGIMTNGGEFCRITNCQISAFDYGVLIGGGNSQKNWILDTQVEAVITGITVQPTATKTIYGTYIIGCDVKQSNASTSQTPGIYIDTNGGTNTNVENINIVGCTIYDWNGSGIQINSARNVNIIGGMISSNGLSPSSTLLGCGVTLSNGSSQPSGVHCVGVDFNGTYDFVGGTQPYCIGVTGGGSIRCWSCTMTANGSGQVFTTAIIGTPDIKLYNCTGYNDSGTVVSSGTVSSATPFTLAGLGYYGPGTVYFSGTNTGLVAQIGSQSLWGTLANSSVGNFRLADSRQQATLTWTGAPTLHILGE